MTALQNYIDTPKVCLDQTRTTSKACSVMTTIGKAMHARIGWISMGNDLFEIDARSRCSRTSLSCSSESTDRMVAYLAYWHTVRSRLEVSNGQHSQTQQAAGSFFFLEVGQPIALKGFRRQHHAVLFLPAS